MIYLCKLCTFPPSQITTLSRNILRPPPANCHKSCELGKVLRRLHTHLLHTGYKLQPPLHTLHPCHKSCELGMGLLRLFSRVCHLNCWYSLLPSLWTVANSVDQPCPLIAITFHSCSALFSYLQSLAQSLAQGLIFEVLVLKVPNKVALKSSCLTLNLFKPFGCKRYSSYALISDGYSVKEAIRYFTCRVLHRDMY